MTPHSQFAPKVGLAVPSEPSSAKAAPKKNIRRERTRLAQTSARSWSAAIFRRFGFQRQSSPPARIFRLLHHSAPITIFSTFLLNAIPALAATPALSLTATLSPVANELALTWSAGKPTYQLQTRPNIDSPWTNYGVPTNATSASVPLTNQSAYFRVVQDYTAQYRVTFDATWSASTHPASFPSSAHWSGLVGGVHNDRVRFWREGETASLGIQLMAERGNQSTLVSEINPAIAAGNAHFTFTGGGIGTSPGSVSLTFPQRMRRDFPLVTLTSMIAPSPDWFVGVDSLSLLENDEWVPTKTVVLYGFDAGTDSGATYSSPDLVTNPRGIITRFTGFPALVNGEIVPFGTFTFTRVD